MREDTKKAFKESGTTTLFIKKIIKEIEERLDDNEKVLFASSVTFRAFFLHIKEQTASIGTLFITDKKMILHYGQSFWIIKSFQEINKIDLGTLNGDHILIDTDDIKVDYIISNDWKMAKKLHSVFMSAYEPYRTEDSQDAVTESAQNNNNIDITEQIEKLSQLKDKGIITEEEFQTKKADLLARL